MAAHIAAPLMLVAVGFCVVGLVSPNPTSAGQGGRIESGFAPVGIQRITRHPFLWGVSLWAVRDGGVDATPQRRPPKSVMRFGSK